MQGKSFSTFTGMSGKWCAEVFAVDYQLNCYQLQHERTKELACGIDVLYLTVPRNDSDDLTALIGVMHFIWLLLHLNMNSQ